MVLGASFVVLSQACGSSDDKKKAIAPEAGGEAGQAGEGASAGSNTSSAGVPSMTGEGGTAGSPTEPSGGGAGGASEPSTPGAAGEAGAAGAPPTTPLVCPDNFGDCNGNRNDGCETSLVLNDQHCGACPNDCTSVGTTCTADGCGDIPVHPSVSLGVGNGAFNDHAFAFSTEIGIANMTKTNSVVKLLPIDGSPAKVIWDSTNGESGNETLVIVGQDIFWAQRGTPNVVRKKAASAAPVTLPTDVFYPDDMPVYLRQQGDYFYWISGDFGEPGYIYRRLESAPTNDPGTLIMDVPQGSAFAITGLAVTTDAIYWITSDDANAATTDNDIRTVPLTGGVPTSIPKVPGAADATIKDFGNFTIVPNLTAIGDTLYFARTIGESTLNGVYRYKKGDAAPTKLAEAENVTAFNVSDTHVYYGLLAQQGVWRAPIEGGQGVKAGNGYQSNIVGVDDKFVYVAIVNQPGSVYKIFR